MNELSTRYIRDFSGFKGDLPKRLVIDGVGSAMNNETELFIANMRRFPLLDGLKHEAYLRDKLELGLKAHLQLQSDKLSTDERLDLERTAVEGAGAFMTIYECNLRLVKSIAMHYNATTSSGIVDIIQDGCIGLRRAIQKFDPKKGFKFSTYATWWIKQSITRHQSEIAYEVKFPSVAIKHISEIKKLISDHAKQYNTDITNKELIEKGYKDYEIYAARNLAGIRRLSLDEQLGSDGDDMNFYSLLPGEEVDFEKNVVNAEYDDLLGSLIERARLSVRDKTIISIRSGVAVAGANYSIPVSIDGFEAKTTGELLMHILCGGKAPSLENIGDIVGLTRERTRQIIEEANIAILRSSAISDLEDRLNLSSYEVDLFHKYFAFTKKITSKSSAETLEKEQQTARRVLDLVSLLDSDIEKSITDTIDYLRAEHSLPEDLINRVNHWLKLRFGLDKDYDYLPISVKSGRALCRLEPIQIKLAEATMLTTLIDQQGKLPKSLQ